jgi:phage terminase large subunit
LIEQAILDWEKDPVQFVREVFDVEPDAWQVNVLNALNSNMRLAMKACKGPGKTCLLAWVCWWFLLTKLHPKIMATSINGDNLRDGLWTEMSKWQQKSQLLREMFKWTDDKIFNIDHRETWYMSARTWAKSGDSSQQANTLAGVHADNVLFVLDEAGGIPDAVMAAAEAGLANDDGTNPDKCAKILMAGNPTHLEGPIYRACTQESHLWHVTEITSDPDDPNRTPRVSVKWAREQIDKYGKDSDWVLVNVFGKFPSSSLNALLGPDDVRAAMSRHLTLDQYDFAQKRIGVDVARFGDDRTVMFKRQGLAAFKPVEMRGARTQEIVARLMTEKNEFGSEMEFVDGTGGWGAGVIDYLYQTGQAPLEVNFSSKPNDPRYFNRRAEMWFLMAEWIKRGGAIPNDPELVRELTAPTYTISKSGKFQLEAKEQIKERLGFSPDKADALALTFALPEMPKTNPLHASKKGLISDYDPFDESRL